MDLFVVIVLGMAALFILTVIFGAPYVPTHASALATALDLAGVGKGKVLVELGAGDGRLLVAAARKQVHAVGYEINPFMWLVAWLRIRPYRQYARVVLGNYKTATWPKNIGALYIFGSHREMKFIERKIADIPKPIRVVSYGFALPGRQPLTERDGLLCYELT